MPYAFHKLPVLLLAATVIWAKPPELTSAFPLGVRAGATINVALRGKALAGAYAVQFDCSTLSGTVLTAADGGAEIQVQAAADAATGFHTLSVVTPAGLSSPIAFRVNREKLFNGRIDSPGKVDRYAVEAHAGERMALEVITGSGMIETNPGAFTVPTLEVYNGGGSWLDPNESSRLMCKDETRIFEFPALTFVEHRLPRLVCEFPRAGHYEVRVAAAEGGGGPDCAYQLRMTAVRGEPVWTSRTLVHHDRYELPGAEFARKLDGAYLAAVAARGSTEAPALAKVAEREPDDSTGQARALTIPAVAEGAIGKPGDTDLYRFETKAGEKLVFELETPRLAPPYFNPHIRVLDAEGKELASNIYRKIDGDGDDWVKSLEPKTTVTFVGAGSHYVEVRDLTSRHGGADFGYRLLVRRAIPHLGSVTVRRLDMGFGTRLEDHLNLAPGESRRLPVVAELEEGYDAELGVSFENLPEGVHAVAAALAPQKGIYVVDQEVYETRWEARMNVHRERYRPRRRLVSILLTADANAPKTRQPRAIRLVVTPAVNDHAGRPVTTEELPLMVGSGDAEGPLLRASGK